MEHHSHAIGRKMSARGHGNKAGPSLALRMTIHFDSHVARLCRRRCRRNRCDEDCLLPCRSFQNNDGIEIGGRS
jgi:hypothetical protein